MSPSLNIYKDVYNNIKLQAVRRPYKLNIVAIDCIAYILSPSAPADSI